MYYCSHCGNPLAEDSVFCQRCGARVAEESTVATASEETTVPLAQSETSAALDRNVEAMEEERSFSTENAPAEEAPAEDASAAVKLLFDGQKTPPAIQTKTLVGSAVSMVFCIAMDVWFYTMASKGGFLFTEKLFVLLMVAITVGCLPFEIATWVKYFFQKTYIDVYTDHVEGLATGSRNFSLLHSEITHVEKRKKYELRITANGQLYRVCARNEYNAVKVMELLRERTKQG